MPNIVICGVLDKLTSSNIWMAKSFKRYGFDILPVNYRTLISKYGVKFFEDLLVQTVKKYNPYLTVFCKCNRVDPNIVAECTKFSKTWLWFMDSYIIAQSCPEIVLHAKNCNFSSCTSQITVDFFKSQGVQNCYHIYEGIDLDIHKPVKPMFKYVADISFVGSKTPERDEYKKLLEDAGYKVKFYGSQYSKELLPPEDWAKVCASSKFMLSLNTFNDIPGYFSGRVFETLGCGTCTLHLDPTGGLKDIFKDGEEIIYFKDKQDLLEKLKKIDAITAKKIAINGREKVLANYTIDHSVGKILKVVHEGSNIK